MVTRAADDETTTDRPGVAGRWCRHAWRRRCRQGTAGCPCRRRGRSRSAGHLRLLGAVVRQPKRAGGQPAAGGDTREDSRPRRRATHTRSAGATSSACPFIMDPGRPLDIRQGPTAVIIVAGELVGAALPVPNRSAQSARNLRSIHQRRLDRALGGRHAGRRYRRFPRRSRHHGDSRRRIPHGEVAAWSSATGC